MEVKKQGLFFSLSEMLKNESGFLCQYLGWQSTFYFSAILGGVLLLLVAFLLPETLRREPAAREENGLASAFKAFGPMLAMFRDPTVLVITLYSTVIFACLYFLASSGKKRGGRKRVCLLSNWSRIQRLQILFRRSTSIMNGRLGYAIWCLAQACSSDRSWQAKMQTLCSAGYGRNQSPRCD